jgi:hypothetical protein
VLRVGLALVSDMVDEGRGRGVRGALFSSTSIATGSSRVSSMNVSWLALFAIHSTGVWPWMYFFLDLKGPKTAGHASARVRVEDAWLVKVGQRENILTRGTTYASCILRESLE